MSDDEIKKVEKPDFTRGAVPYTPPPTTPPPKTEDSK
jgi:hypothetical protein